MGRSANGARAESLDAALPLQVVARLERAESEEPDLVAAIWEDCDTGLAGRVSTATSR